MNEWLKEIAAGMKPEDLPESYQAVARAIGLEAALLLSSELGGIAFYFPKIDGLIQRKRDDAIRKEFNGSNYKDLARKYCLTEVWIRQIVNHRPDDRQAGFGF